MEKRLSVLNKQDFERVVQDRTRRTPIRARNVLVPLKFDAKGDVFSKTSKRPIIKSLTLDHLRFLKAWKENGYTDAKAACEKAGIFVEDAERLAKKLSCFREEDAKVKALAEIPTASWIASKHVENIYEGGLEDSQHKSLQELAKIQGAYKPTTSVNLQITTDMPKLSPDQEKAAREFFDTIAITEGQNAA
jgi:hypothetical protein